MPEVSDVVGIGLAGGQGMRARPLTLKAPGYLRSKAAMSFLGRRLIRWVLQILSSEGIKDYYVIAHGKENRYQIKVMIGYGEGFGVDVKYSPVKYDALSTGSADSALRMLEYWDISQTALVFPTDTIIDFDLEPMLEAHRRTGAIATIAAMVREPDEVAEKYGVLVADDEDRVEVFVEKPSLDELREYFHASNEEEFRRLPLMTNAGFYLIDTARIREVATHPEVERIRSTRLDFGKDLLPWLVGNGFPVHVFPVRRIGDLGNVRDYLETMIEALRGDFESVDRLLGPPFDAERNVWIAPRVARDARLDEREDAGREDRGRGGAHRTGGQDRQVLRRSTPASASPSPTSTTTSRCSATPRSSARRSATVPSSARRRACSKPWSARCPRSGPSLQPHLDRALRGARGRGKVVVYPGVHLEDDVSVYPRLELPFGVSVPGGTEIAGPADVLRHL